MTNYEVLIEYFTPLQIFGFVGFVFSAGLCLGSALVYLIGPRLILREIVKSMNPVSQETKSKQDGLHGDWNGPDY